MQRATISALTRVFDALWLRGAGAQLANAFMTPDQQRIRSLRDLLRSIRGTTQMLSPDRKGPGLTSVSTEASKSSQPFYAASVSA